MPNFQGVWSLSEQYQAIGSQNWPMAPGAPTGVSAAAGDEQATVSFTAPSFTGVPPGITQYLVTSDPGAITETGSASPITVTGLSNGTAYTFSVQATNGVQFGPAGVSGSVSPVDASNRGLFMGAEQANDTIQYIQITSTGNSIDFGDLTVGRGNMGATASSTRAVAMCGTGPSSSTQNVFDYVTIASTGNATDFGDATAAKNNGIGSCSSSTRGVIAGGSAAGRTDVIEYITIASTGNGTDFGDLGTARDNINGGMSNGTRGICAYGGYGGGGPSVISSLEYITIASTGNSSDFGNATKGAFIWGCASNSTRGLAGDDTDIDYITIASTGNASDFGDLATSRGDCTAVANATRCVFTGSGTDDTDYVTIATTGNSSDFGDLVSEGQQSAGVSNAHGGLS
jgi:hypothetical protein